MNLKLISTFFSVFMAMNFAFAQPSDAVLKKKAREFFENSSDIISIDLNKSNTTVKYENGLRTRYWMRYFTIKEKTKYPGVVYNGKGTIRYMMSGSSFIYDDTWGGFVEYTGIPLPDKEKLNTLLKENFDPLVFYGKYYRGYIIDAPNNIELAADPEFRWEDFNELSFNVVTKYKRNVASRKQADIKHIWKVTLFRSEDGVNFDKDAELLKNGKWITTEIIGESEKDETIKEYEVSLSEQKAMRTLKQGVIDRDAIAFRESLLPLDLPEFQGSNHFIQYIHETLIEGDKEKVKSLVYNTMPSFYFEEWSDIVLNRRGKEYLENVLGDLENYKLAFCQHPHIKHIQKGSVSFYDRSKYRFNTIKVSYVNDRWYISEISYLIRDEDYAKHEASADSNCDGDRIFIDEEPEFKAGDPIEVLDRGTWFAGEVVSPDLKNGGYHVIYGASGLKEWFFVNNVRGRELVKGEGIKNAVTGSSGNIKIGKSLKNKKVKVKVPRIKL